MRLLVSGFEEEFGRGRRVLRQAKEQAIQEAKKGLMLLLRQQPKPAY
jgi:hypothetical protein